MKVKILFIVIIIIICAVFAIRLLSGEDNWMCQNGEWIMHGKPSAPKPTTLCPGAKPIKEVSMKLTSPVFLDNQAIPVDYSCQGKGLRPTLTVTGVPANAKSLAITMDDPDAPMGTFHHWLVWNIPASATEIGALLPLGATEGVNSTGRAGYVAPCPPSGIHRYIFTLYALDTTPDLPKNTMTQTLVAAMAVHVIGKATLTGTFGK